MGQRQTRRQREVRNEDEEQNCENEDLKFIETLGKPDESRQDEEEEKSSDDVGGKSPVVVVEIKEETQNLEDWLDDFLDN